MQYGVQFTLLSVVFAVLASGAAFQIVTTARRSPVRLLGGGVVLGAGIGAMHYTGMAAMRMDAAIRYDPLVFAASVVVAVVLSSLALRLLFHSLESRAATKRLQRILSGCVMGSSIAAMHYTGMAATYFLPAGSTRAMTGDLDASLMAASVAAGTFVVVSLSLLASLIDQARKIKLLSAQLNEQSLNAIVHYVDEAIITVGQHGKIRGFNPAAERMFGYDRFEILGKNVSILVPDEFQAEHVKYVKQSALYAPRVIGRTRSLKARRKGGEIFDLELSVSAMEASGRRMYVSVCSDITERMKVAAAMREAKDSAEAANRAKTEFLANMSHELRTPLNAVMGFSEIIKNQALGPVGSPKYREYASDIHDAGQHLLDIINDILDLSKVESGTPELNEEEFAIRDVVDSVVTLVTGQAGKGGVELEIQASDVEPHLFADKRMVKQILVNLLSNAIKFTEPGGTVSLKYWSRNDSGYVFQVRDTGIGMALDDIPRALAAFIRVENDMTLSNEGTGLGLPLSKSLAEIHGGSLDLQSRLGVGTTVTIRFPAERIRILRSSTRSESA